MSLGVNHIRNVRRLYKRILKAHTRLPDDLKFVGDKYVKEEFKRHKSAESGYVEVFMNQWKVYVENIEQQIKINQPNKFGNNLPEEVIERDFNDSHIVQLYELKQAAATDKKNNDSTSN